MQDEILSRLFDVLDEVVGAEGSWQDKRDQIKKWAEHDAAQLTILLEFVTWFEEDVP